MHKKLHGDLKKFARAEMARDMAKRHGKALQLPWDPAHGAPQDAAGGAPGAVPPGVDAKDIEELMEHLRGNGG